MGECRAVTEAKETPRGGHGVDIGITQIYFEIGTCFSVGIRLGAGSQSRRGGCSARRSELDLVQLSAHADVSYAILKRPSRASCLRRAIASSPYDCPTRPQYRG